MAQFNRGDFEHYLGMLSDVPAQLGDERLSVAGATRSGGYIVTLMHQSCDLSIGRSNVSPVDVYD